MVMSKSPFGNNTLEIWVWSDSAWEPVTEAELALVDSILDRLPELLEEVCTRLLARYSNFNDSGEFRELCNRPTLWINRESASGRWSFVVARRADEDDFVAIHLEFQGMTFQEMWAGD